MRKTVPIILSLLFMASSTACNRFFPNANVPDATQHIVDVEPVTAAPTVFLTTAPATPLPATPVPVTEEPSGTPEPSTDTPVPETPTPVPVTEAPTRTPAPATSAPVLSSGKCFFGEYTGTDATYTGREPLPLSNFNNPPMQNTENLPTECINHYFGSPKNGKVDDVIISMQSSFDKKGLDAICYDGRSEGKVIYLTFDLGYEGGCSHQILDTLKQKNVKTTFFCTLPQLKSNTSVMTRIINEGHILGNHSCTHGDFSAMTRSQIYQEIKGFDDYLRTHYGYSSTFFRYPMGKHSINSTTFLNQMGYTCVFWSAAWVDYDDIEKGADVAYREVVGKLHPGAIILLHASSVDNANALADIIDTARSMGYEFRALTDYRG